MLSYRSCVASLFHFAVLLLLYFAVLFCFFTGAFIVMCCYFVVSFVCFDVLIFCCFTGAFVVTVVPGCLVESIVLAGAVILLLRLLCSFAVDMG